jgi:hypothetical protein
MESLERILAANLNAIKKATGLSEGQIAKAARIGTGTAHRALVGQNVQLATLESLASWLKVPAWTLLIAGLDRKNPPKLASDSMIEAEIRRRVQRVLREMGALIADPEETRPDGRSVSVADPFGQTARIVKGSSAAAKTPKGARRQKGTKTG